MPRNLKPWHVPRIMRPLALEDFTSFQFCRKSAHSAGMSTTPTPTKDPIKCRWRDQRRIGSIATALIIASFLLTACNKKPTPVRLLAWIGYDEPDLFAEFSEKEGIPVEVKTFIGGSQMLSMLESAPSRYDVVVLDPEYISLAVSKKLLSPLNPAEYDTTHHHPYFRALDVLKVDGQDYAIPVRFGAIGIMYNADQVQPGEVRSYKQLLRPEFTARLSVFDLWQPVMGTLSLMHYPLRANPYDLNEKELSVVADSLKQLRANNIRVHANVPDLVSHLADERTWIMIGGGEANIPALKERGKNFKALIPEEGGILWMESLGITSTAARKSDAVKLVQYLQKPEGQVKLARRSMYISSPTSVTAVNMMSQNEREIRGIATPEDLDALLKKLVLRRLPPPAMQKHWQEAWDEFLRPGAK